MIKYSLFLGTLIGATSPLLATDMHELLATATNALYHLSEEITEDEKNILPDSLPEDK